MSKLHFKIKNGARVIAVTSDPTDAEEGDLIFRSDLTPPRFRVYRNSAWGDLNDSSYNRLDVANDSSSGSNITLSSPAKPFIRLTNAALASIDGITAGEDGQTIMLTNIASAVVLINNETGTAANQIVTGNFKPIKLKQGGTVLLTYDATSQKWRAISGSGSADLDTNIYLESLKQQLIDSYFQLVTPNIFLLDEDTLVDGTSTGAYNIADDTFDFAASSAQTLVSTDMLDAQEFMTNTDALAEVELSAYWRLASIDTSATYQISRNGGNEWQNITMERVGATDMYRGYHKFTEEIVDQTLNTVALSGTLNSSNQVSQSFVVASGDKYLIKKVNVSGTKTGSPSGYLYLSVCADNAGSPGTVLSESNAISVSSILPGPGSYLVDIPDIYLPAGTYHLKVRSDNAYKSSYSAGVNQISLSSAQSGGANLDLRVKVISSATAGIKKLEGYGIFYDKALAANVASGSINLEVFEFDGGLNTYEFTLTKFTPHPDLLKVYDVNTGQVYDYGAFSFNGQKVTFESGQFYNPGQTIKLRFIQIEGSAFDNSDVNALLMASNHLGSTDASIDRSIAGRGIFLRRPDGTLREICIDNSDNIVVYSV